MICGVWECCFFGKECQPGCEFEKNRPTIQVVTKKRGRPTKPKAEKPEPDKFNEYFDKKFSVKKNN